MRISSISVVGLGKLGACVAVTLAEAGYRVVGVDADASTVSKISHGRAPVQEPGLQRAISGARDRLSATQDTADAVRRSQATFVVVPTPSSENGGFSLDFVKTAMEAIGRGLRSKQDFHLVVLTSTVMPGSMAGGVREALEGSSGKRMSHDFGLCYNPEFIALGDVLNGLRRPDLILIGESDKRSGALLESIQRRLTRRTPAIRRMSFVNAELTKLAINAYVTMKISYANTIAEICEKVPGLDVDVVTRAIGSDSRIGGKYLRGGLGFGGPCFPRDSIAFARLAHDIGAQAFLARATQKVNATQVLRVVSLVKARGVLPPARIAVLGLTYKTNTPVLEASQSVELAERLARDGFEVHAYDPACRSDLPGLADSGIKLERTLKACVKGSELCIIATPWEEFVLSGPNLLRGRPVLDCWRALLEVPLGSAYTAVGRAQSAHPGSVQT